MPVPDRLYKYRAFDARTVELLVEDKVHFSDPSTFNDPLDTRPTLVNDLGVPDLELLLETLTTRRISAEMQAAAKRIRYSGPRTMEHIEQRTRREVGALVRDIAYMATDPEYDDPAPGPQIDLLRRHIEAELLRRYDKGILSLASRYDCPLMWSHYGDQHRGLCLGYSLPGDSSDDLYEVNYEGNRNIFASQVKAMLDGDLQARTEVDAGVLLRKAPDWNYEKEWRMLGARGPADSPLELEEVIFGSRCLPAVQHTLQRALEGRDRPVQFFRMHEMPGAFGLQRHPLDADEQPSTPRRALSLREDFADITKISTGS